VLLACAMRSLIRFRVRKVRCRVRYAIPRHVAISFTTIAIARDPVTRSRARLDTPRHSHDALSLDNTPLVASIGRANLESLICNVFFASCFLLFISCLFLSLRSLFFFFYNRVSCLFRSSSTFILGNGKQGNWIKGKKARNKK